MVSLVKRRKLFSSLTAIQCIHQTMMLWILQKMLMFQLPVVYRLQLVQRSFFKPLYFIQAVKKFMRTGLSVTQYQISQFVTEAYIKAATFENWAHEFKRSAFWFIGLWKQTFCHQKVSTQTQCLLVYIVFLARGNPKWFNVYEQLMKFFSLPDNFYNQNLLKHVISK